MVASLIERLYGKFSREELKKYLLLGFTFALIIGIYWTMRPLKDALFKAIVVGEGKEASNQMLAWAKIVSLCVLIPVIMLYSKLVSMMKKYHMLYLLSGFYGLAMLVFAYLFNHPEIGLLNTVADKYRILGWAWYVFVESYGSLVVALFWAFAADVSNADSARRGFPMVVMLGQLGAIFGPQLTKLPERLNWETSAGVVAICGAAVLLVILMVRHFVANTPKEQLAGFSSQEQKHEEEPGFLEGLKLLLSHRYLLGIFAIITIYEVIVTIFDYNFKTLVFQSTVGDKATLAYLGDYATMVNVVSFLCLAFGISNIQRRLGMAVALGLMPFIIGGMVLLFGLYPDVSVLFWIMVAGKAINYALNGPSMKQLYIPTSEDAKYKSQAWIEMFGSRGAKAFASYFNTFQKVFQTKFGLMAGFSYYIMTACGFSAVLLVGWFFTALYLSRTFNDAVEQKRTIC